MESTGLDYAPSGSPRSPRLWGWRTLVIVAAVLLVDLAAPTVTIRRVESRMDAVTGSMTWKTIWPFGISFGPRVDVSPLEVRLRRGGIAWTPSWQLLHNTHWSMLRVTMYECGSTPPIYQLPRAVLEQFTAASSDAELREFVRVMQSGTEQEQRAAVDSAGEKGLQAGGVTRMGG